MQHQLATCSPRSTHQNVSGSSQRSSKRGHPFDAACVWYFTLISFKQTIIIISEPIVTSFSVSSSRGCNAHKRGRRDVREAIISQRITSFPLPSSFSSKRWAAEASINMTKIWFRVTSIKSAIVLCSSRGNFRAPTSVQLELPVHTLEAAKFKPQEIVGSSSSYCSSSTGFAAGFLNG